MTGCIPYVVRSIVCKQAREGEKIKLRKPFAFRAAAVLTLAGGAVIAAPAVLHGQVLATSSHQTATATNAPLYIQLPADTNGGSGSDVSNTTPAYEILSYDFSVENPTTSRSGSSGSGGGQAKFNDLTLIKYIDSSTVQLFRSVVSGGRYKQIQLNV